MASIESQWRRNKMTRRLLRNKLALNDLYLRVCIKNSEQIDLKADAVFASNSRQPIRLLESNSTLANKYLVKALVKYVFRYFIILYIFLALVFTNEHKHRYEKAMN